MEHAHREVQHVVLGRLLGSFAVGRGDGEADGLTHNVTSWQATDGAWVDNLGQELALGTEEDSDLGGRVICRDEPLRRLLGTQSPTSRTRHFDPRSRGYVRPPSGSKSPADLDLRADGVAVSGRHSSARSRVGRSIRKRLIELPRNFQPPFQRRLHSALQAAVVMPGRYPAAYAEPPYRVAPLVRCHAPNGRKPSTGPQTGSA